MRLGSNGKHGHREMGPTPPATHPGILTVLFSKCVCIFLQVPSIGTGAHRQIPSPFLAPAARAAMANVTIPMGESVAFKKLLKQKVREGWAVGVSARACVVV